MPTTDTLSRRERQIIDALYALREGGAREIADAMREPDALDTVRVTLGVLERKGYVRHRVEGRRHVYVPTQAPEQASKSAWRRLTKTFFGGSAGRALISFLDANGDKLRDDELAELSQWVEEQARRRKRS
jgi:BlaI family transcriptional regulator, penicillinase repressor